MISVTSGSRTNGSKGPRPRTLSPIWRTMSSFSCAESGPSSSSGARGAAGGPNPRARCPTRLRRTGADPATRPGAPALALERPRSGLAVVPSRGDLQATWGDASLALPGTGEQALLLLLSLVIGDLDPSELAHLRRAPGEPRGQAVDRVRDLGAGLFEHHRTALVEGRRN